MDSLFQALSANPGHEEISSPPAPGIPPDPTQYRAVIEGNEIYQNNRSGLRIRGSLPVRIEKCNIYGNGRAGLRLERQAKVLLEYSQLYGNQGAGLDALNIDELQCREIGIFENQGAGVRIRTGRKESFPSTSFDMIESNVFLNGQAGIYSSASSSAAMAMYLFGNRIHDNARAGLRGEGALTITALQNEIFSNGTSGLFFEGNTTHAPIVDLLESRIYFNKRAGILLRGGGTGSFGITNNWIFHNLESGIGSFPGKEGRSHSLPIRIYHNTIVANGSKNEGAGIRNDSNATMDIRNNIVAYNLRTGIMTYRCADASSNLLFANGQIPEFKESGDHSFFIRRMQYGGCPAAGPGDVLANPLFIAPDSFNFSISENSPAAGAASILDMPYLNRFHRHDMGALLVPCRDIEAGAR